MGVPHTEAQVKCIPRPSAFRDLLVICMQPSGLAVIAKRPATVHRSTIIGNSVLANIPASGHFFAVRVFCASSAAG